MKLNTLAAVLGAALSCVVAGAASAQITDNTVRIGVLTDMAGPYSDPAGAGSVLAAQMAIDDFKARTKPAFNIELVSADHQNKPDIAANLARQWFERDKVDMITDLVSSSAALAVSQIAKDRNRVVIVTGAASNALTGANCNAVTAHWVFDVYALTAAAPMAMIKKGGKSWYFVTADYSFGHALETAASDAVKAAGGSVVGGTRYPFPGTSDFSSPLLKAQSSGAQVIALANAGADLINTVKQAGEYGIAGSQQLVSLLGSITEVHALGLKAAAGLTVTEGFYWDANEETRAWSRRFFVVRKKMPTMVQAGAYSATMHYLKAVQAARTDDTAAVMKKMRELPVNDIMVKNGKLREDGRMVYDMALYEVKKYEDSQYPWDYYKLKTKIPAAEAFLPLEKSSCPLVIKK